MRVPVFAKYGRGMQAAAFFLCGMIVGAAVYSALVLDQTNRIVLNNYELKEQAELAEQQARQKEKPNAGETVISSIVLYVNEAPGREPLDAVAESALKEKLMASLKRSFMGRKIYDIGSDAALARSLLDGAVYPDIEKKDYTVHIRTALAADGRLTIWAEAAPLLRR